MWLFKCQRCGLCIERCWNVAETNAASVARKLINELQAAAVGFPYCIAQDVYHGVEYQGDKFRHEPKC